MGFQVPPSSSVVRKGLIFFSLAVCFLANTAPAQTAPPEALTFFKNYFVTGDYAVGGIGLRGKGDASGYAPGQIVMSGIPDGAVIVAAFLYWQTIESTPQPSSADGFFQGYAINGKAIGLQTPPCWSGGGATGTSQGAITLRAYRADVRPYLVVNGQYQPNGPFQVRLHDSGSNGNSTPLTEGASLVVVYRTLNAPLKAVVLYDGAWTMNQTTAGMFQTIQGFYQAASPDATPRGRLTHIVADGQANFSEELFFNSTSLAINPFTGASDFSWDNLTFNVTVPDNASSVTTNVAPVGSNFDCLSWGAVVFSTPVKDQDGDGLLDTWEDSHGYADMKDGSWVALPSSDKAIRDIYVQVDYLKTTSTPTHSHLPKQAALDLIGAAFGKQVPKIAIHFDVGNAYQNGDQYIVPFQAGTPAGGNAIDESTFTCHDGTTLCQFPELAGTIRWKGDLQQIKNQYFQHGRKDSYHYLLAGHTLGLAPTTWAAALGTLVSVTNSGGVATIATSTAHGLSAGARVTVTGVMSDFDLDGSYNVQTVPSPTTFTIATHNVTDGAYGIFTSQALGAANAHFSEPSLAVSTGTPKSKSGYSDLAGGDFLTTLGAWLADDPAGCEPNPAASAQVYCNNQVGTTVTQAGTIMHELGHNLMLTHGGFYPATATTAAALGENCKPNFLSVMNYQFQIRGLPGGLVDYSGQRLTNLNEGSLIESASTGGLGHDLDTNALPAYGTRFFGPPNFLDQLLQAQAGGRYMKAHCDGTPLNGDPDTVRVDAPDVTLGVDWNNDTVVGNSTASFDANFNGHSESSLLGYDDWQNLNLRQLAGRRNVAGFSVDIGSSEINPGGGGLDPLGGGGGLDPLGGGGGLDPLGGGGGLDPLGGGGGLDPLGGGGEIDFELANRIIDPPTILPTTTVLSKGCAGKVCVQLNWSAPGFGLIRTYYVWRADVTKTPMSPTNLPVLLKTLTGTPPATTYSDASVKGGVIYLYFVTAALAKNNGANSGNSSAPSNSVKCDINAGVCTLIP
jgi:hypothetical protein